ncbi:unnamed protein product [Symbiodinium natans]|uniref:Uncharacterized protein n=1 Tax=Symbiodinium natans TaxID=878477 RepID=A0A812I730_9DINO|nr:unnamed protein product [Symbiodinium natans]
MGSRLLEPPGGGYQALSTNYSVPSTKYEVPTTWGYSVPGTAYETAGSVQGTYSPPETSYFPQNSFAPVATKYDFPSNGHPSTLPTATPTPGSQSYIPTPASQTQTYNPNPFASQMTVYDVPATSYDAPLRSGNLAVPAAYAPVNMTPASTFTTFTTPSTSQDGLTMGVYGPCSSAPAADPAQMTYAAPLSSAPLHSYNPPPGYASPALGTREVAPISSAPLQSYNPPPGYASPALGTREVGTPPPATMALDATCRATFSPPPDQQGSSRVPVYAAPGTPERDLLSSAAATTLLGATPLTHGPGTGVATPTAPGLGTVSTPTAAGLGTLNGTPSKPLGSIRQVPMPSTLIKDPENATVTQHHAMVMATREQAQPEYLTGRTQEVEGPPQVTQQHTQQVVNGEVQQQVVEVPNVQVHEIIQEIPEVQIVDKIVEVPRVVQQPVEHIVEEIAGAS